MAFDESDEQYVDQELMHAFAGVRAPVGFASSVMKRVRIPPPTRLPEVLDAIACMGVLSFAAGVAFFVIVK